MHSLKARFLFIFIFIIFSLTLLLWNDNTISSKIKQQNDDLIELKELQINLLQMRRAEKDFFLRKDIKYRDKLLSLTKKVKNEFIKIDMQKDLYNYQNTFVMISDKMIEIGLDENQGLKHKFRVQAHKLEKDLKNSKNIKLLVNLLQLRRHEKDFLLRHDIKYLKLHQTLFRYIKANLNTKGYTKHLNNYNSVFLELTNKMKLIGLSENLSLRLKMRDNAHKIENNLQTYTKNSTIAIKNVLNELRYSKYIISIILMLLIIMIFIVILKPVYNAFLYFKEFFINFKHSKQRIDTNRLKCSELQDVARVVNTMLSNRELLEKDLIDSRDEALHLQKIKEQFLTNMSHELRTPLNAIIGFSSILSNKFSEEKMLIDPIIDSSKHLLKIINEILDLSKIQSGKFTINNEIFEIQKNLKVCISTFEYIISKKNIDFSVKYNIEEELYLISDWFRISQVIINLLSNAFKFTHKGGKVSLEINYNDNILSIRVEDDGIGISDEAKKRIFNPFEQADSSTTKKFGGTGLGLSISNSIAMMMNGSITIDTQKDKGSVFTFIVKVDRANKQTIQEPISIEDDKTISAHILVVEDNKTNQLLLTMLLDDIGITYDIANDGLEAIERYNNNKYDIVLMDENMPNMNGVDAMLNIRHNHTNVVPIIAVTANVMHNDKTRLLKAGMDAIIPKPIDDEELRNTISMFLQS